MSQPSSIKKTVKGRGVPHEQQRKVGFHEVDVTGRSDETPTEYNCWIVQANYTPEDHKEPARSLQANVMNQEHPPPYDTQTESTTQQADSQLQQASTESHESSVITKETRASEESWQPPTDISQLSPQEADLIRRLRQPGSSQCEAGPVEEEKDYPPYVSEPTVEEPQYAPDSAAEEPIEPGALAAIPADTPQS